MLAVGSKIDMPPYTAAVDRLSQYLPKCWNRPDADELGFLAFGLPPDSHAIIRMARSTSAARKYVSTRLRHRSTPSPTVDGCGALEAGCVRVGITLPK